MKRSKAQNEERRLAVNRVSRRYGLDALTTERYRRALYDAYDRGYRSGKFDHASGGWGDAISSFNDKLEEAVRNHDIDYRAAERLREAVIGPQIPPPEAREGEEESDGS